MTSEIDEAVATAADAFVHDIFAAPLWRGREHEAVSHFTLFLQRQCRDGRVLYDPTQIVMGACVQGVPGLNPEGRVNKDLVVWPRGRMSCWDAEWAVSNIPLAVLEWKVFRLKRPAPAMSGYDLYWLQEFSRNHAQFVGYAISLDLRGRQWRLRADRVRNGDTEAEWLRL